MVVGVGPDRRRRVPSVARDTITSDVEIAVTFELL
jgi:hypothetical protein